MLTDPPAACLPATIAWSATAADAYGEPPLPDTFCVELVVLNGERHIYRLHRKTLMELNDRISQIFAKPAAPWKRSVPPAEEGEHRIPSPAREPAQPEQMFT
ncbi:MAG TPA: hypothetical protein VK456_12725 [Xanthobacteraceae bacterium]|nr:hypothetical protein [Xanthobacteraceae bacterium]